MPAGPMPPAAALPAPPPAPVVPARPFLKWAGGKKQLLASFEDLYPAAASIGAYHEPFLGSGAVFFHVRSLLRPRAAMLSDSNQQLIETFTAVRDQVEAVIAELEVHHRRHSKRHFYLVRKQVPAELATAAARAARFIYLNKTCFNGLYRVNSRGLFNVPMGRYQNPNIVDAGRLQRASHELAGVDLRTGPFTTVQDRAKAGDFVYFDPPYVPLSSTAYFTAYTEGAFGPDDQRRLADTFRLLARRGCLVMLSNSDTELVRELYDGFHITQVMARRNINSNSERRGHVPEVVVTSYRERAVPVRARSSASAKSGKVAKRGTGASR